MQKFQFCKGDVQKHYSTLRTLMRSRKKTNKMHAKFGMRSRQSQFYSLQGELKFMQANIYIHDYTDHPKSAASYHNNQATVHRAARLAQKKKKTANDGEPGG